MEARLGVPVSSGHQLSTGSLVNNKVAFHSAKGYHSVCVCVGSAAAQSVSLSLALVYLKVQ